MTTLSISKFDSPLAEMLYAETPDDEFGSSTEGNGWYGLYIAEGVILFESPIGFVDIMMFDTPSDTHEAWANLLESSAFSQAFLPLPEDEPVYEEFVDEDDDETEEVK